MIKVFSFAKVTPQCDGTTKNGVRPVPTHHEFVLCSWCVQSSPRSCSAVEICRIRFSREYFVQEVCASLTAVRTPAAHMTTVGYLGSSEAEQFAQRAGSSDSTSWHGVRQHPCLDSKLRSIRMALVAIVACELPFGVVWLTVSRAKLPPVRVTTL